MGVLDRLNAALVSALQRFLKAARHAARRPMVRRQRRSPALRRWPNAGTLPSEVMAAAYGGTAATDGSRRSAGADLHGMLRELTALLDAHEGSRRVFRYLAHFEQRLASKGLRVLDEMSVKHLRRALAQFEAIITDWSPANLADLRSRMAVAVSVRDSAAALWMPAQTLSQAYEPRPMPVVALQALEASRATPSDGLRH